MVRHPTASKRECDRKGLRKCIRLSADSRKTFAAGAIAVTRFSASWYVVNPLVQPRSGTEPHSVRNLSSQRGLPESPLAHSQGESLHIRRDIMSLCMLLYLRNLTSNQNSSVRG